MIIDECLQIYVFRPLGLQLAEIQRLSGQARIVREILLDKRIKGDERYQRILAVFETDNRVETDSAYWIIAALSAYQAKWFPKDLVPGPEPLQLEAPSELKVHFWRRLATRFAEIGSFWFGLADELYWQIQETGAVRNAAEREAFEFYVKALELDPSLFMLMNEPNIKEWKRVGGEIFLRYRLAEIRAWLDRYLIYSAACEAEDIRAEYRDHPETMARVRSTLGKYADFAQHNLDAIRAYARGHLLAASGRHQEAIDAYSEALKIAPDYARAYFGRGYSREAIRDPGADADHIQGETIRHRRVCEAFRVRPAERRTTPQPEFHVVQFFPELADLAATMTRLHPRYGSEPAQDASKLGGLFLWSEHERWPVCEEHGCMPYVGVLQLRAEDFPEMLFRPGSDLFQLLWCPQDHNMWIKPAAFWRKRADVTVPRKDYPDLNGFHPRRGYVPTPCALLPERITEYPTWDDLSQHMRDKVEQRVATMENVPAKFRHERQGPMTGLEFYCDLWPTCPGCKVGGYPCWIQSREVPLCACGRPMRYLFTLSSDECDAVTYVRWLPEEEQRYYNGYQNDACEGTERAHGLLFGDLGAVYFFVCCNCPEWPVKHIGQCS